VFVWLLASNYWQGIKYAQVWIVGAYASVASAYFTYLLASLSVSICGVQLFLLASIMLAVTYVIRPRAQDEGVRTFDPLRLIYAWIGLPLVLVFAYDLLYGIPHQGMLQLGVMIGLVAVLGWLEYFVGPDELMVK
jgi:hypothetical protein